MASNAQAEDRIAARKATGFKYKMKQRAINWELYLLLLLPVAWLIVFMYVPMYGNIIAFKKYSPTKGMWGSPWVGFTNFVRFVKSFNFVYIMRNTLVLNLYDLVVGFPLPIMLAILLNYTMNLRYKKTVQMVTYAPHFISQVVMVGIIFKLFSERIGLINVLLMKLGLPEMNFLGSALWFPHVYVWTTVWQNMGWASIIYLAALSGVDPELHESAKVDGAVIWQRIIHIDMPSILPTVIILLILRSGQILNIGFEKVFLMQNALNISASEVIQTYVYKIGIAAQSPNFSYATSIGLLQNAISFLLLLTVNKIARRVGETSLW